MSGKKTRDSLPSKVLKNLKFVEGVLVISKVG